MPNTLDSRRWSDGEIKILDKLVRENLPTSRIAMQMKRSEAAVRTKATELGYSPKQ